MKVRIEAVYRVTAVRHTTEDGMSMNELCTKGAGELAAMIRDRQVTSREVVDVHLARVAEVNPSVNAATVTLADGDPRWVPAPL